MKTALIAAAALAATTLTGLPEASAKGLNFALTIGGQNGVIKIVGPGNGHKRLHAGQFNRQINRGRGHCMNQNQIRRMLRHQGWQGYRVSKLTPVTAVVQSHRHGIRYSLKLNRCTGKIIQVRRLGGYWKRG